MGNRKRPPAIGIEARENEMIAKSVDLAERRIEEGTASDSLIIHFLRLGTTKMQLEKEKLRADVELSKTKAKSIEESDNTALLYIEAINAMREYRGESRGNEDQDL